MVGRVINLRKTRDKAERLGEGIGRCVSAGGGVGAGFGGVIGKSRFGLRTSFTGYRFPFDRGRPLRSPVMASGDAHREQMMQYLNSKELAAGFQRVVFAMLLAKGA